VTSRLGEFDEKKPNFIGVNCKPWASSSGMIWLGQVWASCERVSNVPTFPFYLVYSPLVFSSPFPPKILKLTQIWG